MTDASLKTSARQRYDVAIIGGAGHVGLPLALVLANAGMKTLIVDLAQTTMAKIQAGELPFKEEGAEPLLAQALRAGSLGFTSDYAATQGIPTLIVTIGTPIDSYLNPVYEVMSECIDQLLPHLSDDQLLVLRSTVPPGVTDWLQRYLQERHASPALAFCPERVVQGKAIQEIQSIPQLVSAPTPEAAARAAEFFAQFVDRVVHMSTQEAEFAKLFCNAYRYMQFAISNQFYMMTASAGLDYNRILDGMKMHYPRMQDVPSAGLAAGPCLYKDTLQLASFYDNQFSLGFDAMMVNEGLPLFIARQLTQQFPLHERTVGLLGMAFKANSDDTRSSLSYKLKKVLHSRAQRVLSTDPHVTTDSSLLDVQAVVAGSDVLVLCAPHAEYRDLDLRGTPVVDIWGFFPESARLSASSN